MKTRLILDQMNNIMDDTSIRAWWLPIIEERVRQNTIRQAQMINFTFHGLANLDMATKETLGNLIDQGEIDGALLLELTTSPGDIKDHRLDVEKTESASTPSVSDPIDGTEIQPIINASADLSKKNLKKNLKNNRKKEKRRAKYAAKSGHEASASALNNPNIANSDASAISRGSGNVSEDTTITQANISAVPEPDSVSNGTSSSQPQSTTPEGLDSFFENDAFTGPVVSVTLTEPDDIPNVINTTQPEVLVSAEWNVVSQDSNSHKINSTTPSGSIGFSKDVSVTKLENLFSSKLLLGESQNNVSPDIRLATAPVSGDDQNDIISTKSKDLTISTESQSALQDTGSLEFHSTTSNSFNISPNDSASSLPENSTSDYSGPTQESLVDVTKARTDATIEGSTDSSNEESVSDTTEEFSDDSSDESDENEDNSNLPILPLGTASGAMGLQWTYATHTPADDLLLSSGSWLFEKPPDHFHWQPYVWKRHGLGIEQAPVVMDSLRDSIKTPEAEFDNKILFINNHMAPWDDLRAGIFHPDMLPETKLVEYQAAESMGLNVWRHDRDLLDCRLLGCYAKVADFNLASVVCLGCGPKTMIRYCSVAHMVADLHEHWHECGHRDLVIKRVVDHSTTPLRFDRLCIAIRDSNNTKSYALYRQATHAMLNYGRYTLFDFETEEPTVLVWTTEDTSATEMERRVERLLNLALFDQRNKIMIGFLFRLLRQCLQLKNSWTLGTSHALRKQFHAEFDLDAAEVREDLVCECEWAGDGLPEPYHLPTCSRLYRLFGQTFHATGMQGYLEMYEDRYWILRAWQQQHPTVRNWRDRAAGHGFPGAVEAVPVLGPGWIGWGTDRGDMHD